MLLELAALTLAAIHFGVPLLYYFHLKSRHLNEPWNIKVDENYRPRVTIILPTYREAEYIWDRLDNINAQNYPRDLTEIIVADSASDDGTVDLVKKWASEHTDVNLPPLLVKELLKQGYSLRRALWEVKLGWKTYYQYEDYVLEDQEVPKPRGQRYVRVGPLMFDRSADIVLRGVARYMAERLVMRKHGVANLKRREKEVSELARALRNIWLEEMAKDILAI